MTRPTSLIRNVLSNWAVLAANVGYALLITPVIVRALETELYGVWSFLNILVAYSELLYLGLGSALIKHVAQARAGDDRSAVNRLTSVVASIYGAIGLGCLVLLISVSGTIPSLFATPLSPAAAAGASLTCILLGVRLLALFVGSAFAGVLVGHDRYDLVNAVYLGSVIARLIITPWALGTANDPLVTLATITTIVGGAELAALAVIAYQRLPGLALRPVRPTSAELKVLYGFGLQSFFILLAVKLISHSQLTVIGLSLGAASVALYSLPLQLIDYARMMVGGFAGVFLPRLTIIATQGDIGELRFEFLRASRLALFLAAWLTSTLVMIGPAFLSIWVGGEFSVQARWILIWLGAASCLHVLITQVPLAFYQAMEIMVRPALVLVAEGIVNVVLSILLAPTWGIAGVAFATAVPAFVVSFLVLPPYLCRHLGLRVRTLIGQAIAPGALLIVTNIPMLWVVGRLVSIDSYIEIIATGALSASLVGVVFLVAFPIEERRHLLGLLTAALRPAGTSYAAGRNR